MTAEGGGVTLDGELVTAGTRVMADNGATYQAGALPDGTLGAVYVPDTATVALGLHGGSVTLSLQEDRATWTDAGGAAVASGGTTTAGGNAYVLTLAGGVWSAAYSPSSMPIAGTGLTAVMNEDGSGYDVAGATLPASGMGDVAVDGGMFRVWMMDGALMGARYDLQRNGDTDRAVGDLGAGATMDNLLGHLPDDPDTDANENLTKLRLRGHSGTLAFPFGELLDGGSSSMMDHNFVAEARKRIAETRADVAALLGLQNALDDTDLTAILRTRWSGVRMALEGVFGKDGLREGTPDEDEILADLDDILAALASADALAAAAMKDGDGVLEMLELSADQAAAHRSEATASFGVAGATRYGTIVETTRENADADAKLQQTFTHQLVGVGSTNTEGGGTETPLTGFDANGKESDTIMTPALDAALAALASYSEPTDAQIATALENAIRVVYDGTVKVESRGNEMDTTTKKSIVPHQDYYRYRIELDDGRHEPHALHPDPGQRLLHGRHPRRERRWRHVRRRHRDPGALPQREGLRRRQQPRVHGRRRGLDVPVRRSRQHHPARRRSQRQSDVGHD